MFNPPTLSHSPPASVEEALERARGLFAQAGIEGAEVTVTRPPLAGEPLKGACLEASLPVASLEAAVRKVAEAQAAAQGVKISRLQIRFQNGSEETLALQVHAEVDVRAFGATMTLQIRGLADATGGESVQFRELQLDAGSGLFSGMATALIRPDLDSVGAQKVDLTRLAGVPVRLLRMECPADGPERLCLGGQFV
jgi:hypothetical protein